MINFDLLKSLYCIHSKSMNEKKMRKFIMNWVRTNVPDAKVEKDSQGNVLVTRGIAESYPCICSHMDQVQDYHSKDFKVCETDEILFGYSPKMRERQGLGADDKNGIWIALMCLAKYDVMKCAFFVGEEIGCVGSHAVNISFFDDCRFCVQCDRKGYKDLVTNIYTTMCSDEFLDDSGYNEFGYEPHSGMMTDVATLRDRGVKCSCVNMSCGYYDPHTDDEYTIKADLLNCLAFVENIIEKCTKVYEFDAPSRNDWFDFGGGWRTRYGHSRAYEKDMEMDDAREQLITDMLDGVVTDHESFMEWKNDYYMYWVSLKDSDFDTLFEECQEYIGMGYEDFEDAI